MGAAAFGFRTQYSLTAEPDSSTGPLEVRINGTLVPAGGTTWTYDAVSNSVIFAPASAPVPGDTLSLSYPTACYP